MDSAPKINQKRKSLLIKAGIAAAVVLIAAVIGWKVTSDRTTQAIYAPIDYYSQDIDTYDFPSDTADSLKAKGNTAVGSNDRNQGMAFYVYAIRNELLSGENEAATSNLDYTVTLANGTETSDKERLVFLLCKMFRSIRSELQRHESYGPAATVLMRTLALKKSISEKPDYETMFMLSILPQIVLDQSRNEKDDGGKKNLQAQAIAFATEAVAAAKALYQAGDLHRERCIWQASHVIDAAGDAQHAHMILEEEKKDVEGKVGAQAVQLIPLIARMAMIEEELENDKGALYKQADNIEKIALQKNPLFLKDSAFIAEAAWDLGACSNQTSEDAHALDAVAKARKHLTVLSAEQGAMAGTVASYTGLRLN